MLPRVLRLLGILLLAGGGSLLPSPSFGQEAPAPRPPGLEVHPEDRDVTARLGPYLFDPRFLDSLRDGLPLRIHLRVELWRDGWIDRQAGTVEWRASIVRDPLDGRYRVTSSDRGTEIPSGSLSILQRWADEGIRLPLPDSRSGRHYILASVEVETLSLSDLDELQRWLRGELGPALQGDRRVDGAITRGMGRFLQRALRLPALRVRMQSDPFDL